MANNYKYPERRAPYTAAEKRAYHSGQAYKIAENEKAIIFKNPKNKESFKNGYNSITPAQIDKMPDNRRAAAKKAEEKK